MLLKVRKRLTEMMEEKRQEVLDRHPEGRIRKPALRFLTVHDIGYGVPIEAEFWALSLEEREELITAVLR